MLLLLQSQLIVDRLHAQFVVALVSRTMLLNLSQVVLEVLSDVSHLLFEVFSQILELLFEAFNNTLLVELVILLHLPE